MKGIFMGMSCLILCISLMACSNHPFNSQNSYYSNFTAAGEGEQYELSGRAQVANTLPLLYISALEDASVDLTGELTSISTDIQIVYIGPDNKETIIFHNSRQSKRTVKLDTTIHLEKGKSRIDFRGKDASFRFNLLFTNVADDKFEYFSAEENEDSEDHKTRNSDESKLLKEISVTYTDQDDNCTVLHTHLDTDTRLKVLVQANVSDREGHGRLSFGGFCLTYRTDDKENIQVLKYETDESALGGYEWQDHFVQEIELPEGANELIFNHGSGANYEIRLDVQIWGEE